MGKIAGIDSGDQPAFLTGKHKQRFAIRGKLNTRFHKNGDKGANPWHSF
jgi:hypothetical protein